MQCKLCGGDSAVKDSRDAGPFRLRRRRECVSCGARWTTYEAEVMKDEQEERRTHLEKTMRQIRDIIETS